MNKAWYLKTTKNYKYFNTEENRGKTAIAGDWHLADRYGPRSAVSLNILSLLKNAYTTLKNV